MRRIMGWRSISGFAALLVALFVLGSECTYALVFGATRPSRPSRAVLSLRATTVDASTTSWSSALSTSDNLGTAVDEALTAANQQGHRYNVALFFVSSIYEASAFQYQTIVNAIHEQIPSITHVIGCTTGAVVGPKERSQEPLEVEARAAISIMLGSVDATAGVSADTLEMSAEQVAAYLSQTSKDGKTKLLSECSSGLQDGANGATREDEGKVLFMLATGPVQPQLAQLVTALDRREGVTCFGAVASSVTTLHTPKVFLSTRRGPMQKLTNGLVGLYLRGDVSASTIMARSCSPIGPAFKVEAAGPDREILMLRDLPKQKEDGGAESGVDENEPQPPLVMLDRVLGLLPPAQADALKRELLVAVVGSSSDASASKVKTAGSSKSDFFFGQKPTAFNPLTGSITVPSPVPEASTFQFCMRDATAARANLAKAASELSLALTSTSSTVEAPSALLMLGSMERGNKVFRFSSWEAKLLHSTLLEAGSAKRVAMSGLFSAGTFGLMPDGSSTGSESGGGGSGVLMETDSMYVLLGRRRRGSDPTSALGTDAAASSLSLRASSASAADSVAASLAPDMCTTSDISRFSDRADLVIVSKRDPEAAAPVKVASMDYVIPEKAPQPSNVLESLVWERERDVDRMRERFQLARALILAKAAEGKFKKRDFAQLVREACDRHSTTVSEVVGGNRPVFPKPLIVEFCRESLNNGRLDAGAAFSLDGAKVQLQQFAADVRELAADQSSVGDVSVSVSVAAVGCNVDFGTFRGSYEDLESLRQAMDSLGGSIDSTPVPVPVPVLCSDFVVYGYQLFRAKAAGADAVKLMASVLSVQDLNYLTKIAATLGMQTVVQVSSKPQLLAVLDPETGVKDLECLSVCGRNGRLWKLDKSKVVDLLTDTECLGAISARRAQTAGSPGEAGHRRLLVVAEGVSREAVQQVAALEAVDVVCVGEELLACMQEQEEGDRSFKIAVQSFLNHN